MGEHWRSIQWAANLELDIDKDMACKGSEVEEAEDKCVCVFLCSRYHQYTGTAKGTVCKSGHMHASWCDTTEKKKKERKTTSPQSICQYLARGKEQGVTICSSVKHSHYFSICSSQKEKRRKGDANKQRKREVMEKKIFCKICKKMKGERRMTWKRDRDSKTERWINGSLQGYISFLNRKTKACRSSVETERSVI